MAAETAARAAAAVPAAALSEGDGAPPLLRAALAETVDELAGEIVDLSRDIHSHPEVGYAEHHAVAAVAGLLRAHGVEPTVGVYGMDTALRAVVGPTTRADPGPVVSAPVCDTAARVAVPADSAPAAPSSDPIPVIAILAEYDALPGIGLLRQQILPMDRLHAVVVDGGRVPNVVPERSELNIFVRSKYPETLKDLVGRVEDVLRGAALMTGTGLEIITPPYTNEMPVRSNGPLGRSWVRSRRERGRDPLPAGVVSETIAAGTDFGNVSQRLPGIHPLIKVTDRTGVALHTREMERAAGGATGDAAAVDGAYGLAAVALDWLHDGGFRRAVRTDFEAGGTVDVEHFWQE